jgi:uncharacterized protein (DUF1786 family)
MEIPKRILAIDIGSGTQDVLVWQHGVLMENSVQMVLPSPTTSLAQQVFRATALRQPIHLSGHLMGGGPVCWAVRDHLAAGLTVTAAPQAALTLHDNLDRVQEMGIRIQRDPPADAAQIRMGDIQKKALENALIQFGVDPPDMWGIAVQDHGHQPHGSNRTFRFQHWQAFLNEHGGEMQHTIYHVPPRYFTRMQAALDQVAHGMVMDTGMAAIHGALCDPTVQEHVDRGVLVVNLGNQHTLAALVTNDRIQGLWEHHTGALTADALASWMHRFRKGEVSNHEVLATGGHGCAYLAGGTRELEFPWIAATGPRRAMAKTHGWFLAAPFGNMMLAGCYGIVRAFHRSPASPWPTDA